MDAVQGLKLNLVGKMELIQLSRLYFLL